jgi:hypothetical protein
MYRIENVTMRQCDNSTMPNFKDLNSLPNCIIAK